MTGSLKVAVLFVCKEANGGSIVCCRHWLFFAEVTPYKTTISHHFLFAEHYNTFEVGNLEMRYFAKQPRH